MAVDATGIYLHGAFEGTVDFDPDETGGGAAHVLTADGGNQYQFVAKWSLDGVFQWVRQVDEPWGTLATDGNGDIFVAGMTEDADPLSVTNPDGTTLSLFNQDTVPGNVRRDGYVLKLTPDGVFTNAWQFADLEIGPMAVDSSGVYLAGTYSRGPADWDPGPDYTQSLLPPADNNRVVILKMDPNGQGEKVWSAYTSEGYLLETFGLAVSNDRVFATGGFFSTVDFDATMVQANDTLTSAGWK